MYQLVLISEETYEPVLELMRTYAEERGQTHLVHGPTCEWLIDSSMDQGTGYVLLRDSTPIGTLIMLKHPYTLNHTLTALSPLLLYVHKDHRGSGRGFKMMLDKFEEHSAEVDFSSIALGSFTEVNDASLAKRGYRVLEKMYYKEGSWPQAPSH